MPLQPHLKHLIEGRATLSPENSRDLTHPALSAPPSVRPDAPPRPRGRHGDSCLRRDTHTPPSHGHGPSGRAPGRASASHPDAPPTPPAGAPAQVRAVDPPPLAPRAAKPTAPPGPRRAFV